MNGRHIVFPTIVILVVGLFLLIRGIWYYPAFRRPPMLAIQSNAPVFLPETTISGSGKSLVRIMLVEDDKYRPFPENQKNGWSAWRPAHRIVYNNEPKWRKLFVEEKWLLFRKRTDYLFYHVGKQFPVFQQLMENRHKTGPEDVAGKYSFLFLGDSLTRGLFASKEEKGFSGILNHDIGKAHLNDDMVAIPGKDLKGLYQDKRTDILKMLEKPFDVVIVELGTNDFAETPLNEFRRYYKALLQDIMIKKPHALIICLGLWRGYGSYAYDEIINSISSGEKIPFVYLGDLFEDLTTHSTVGSLTSWGPADSFHPSDRGHALIAERIKRVIRMWEQR